MSLVDKYAPKKPEDLVGKSQQNIAKALLAGVETGNITQKILFSGPSGVGKTSISKMYASALAGSESIRHINCRENSSIGFIRDEILPQIMLNPIFGDYRVLFLDEVHGLSSEAQEALLNTLENLPSHVVILAATTDPQKLKPALASRLNVATLPIPSRKELGEFLLRVFREEGISVEKQIILNAKITTTADVVADMINRANGNVRTLLGFVEQLANNYYTANIEEESPESVVKLLLAGKGKQEVFRAASRVSSYHSEAVTMCSYAIKVMEHREDDKLSRILDLFGQGLSPHTSEKVSFYHLLNRFYGK